MITIKKSSINNYILMLLCLCIAAVLCIGHITGSRLFVTFAMVVFMAAIVFTSMAGKALYLVCFFLAWAPLMKFEPGTMSLYTVGLIGVCVLTWLRYRMMIQQYVLPAMALIMLTAVVRLFYGLGIDNSFIMFCIILLLFPVIGHDLHKTYDFYHLNLFFSIGVISAALSACFLVQYSSIAKFIDVYSWNEITRYSGYYGDANFYSAHISAALAGLMIQFLGSRKRMWGSILLSVLLLYCGFLSASKSFVITVAVIALLGILQIFNVRRNISDKIMTVMTVVAVVVGIVASNAFADVFRVIAIRFGNTSDLYSLTTGRSAIWMDYLRYMESNPVIIFFGKGYVNIFVAGHSTHNTLLQGVYQFGIVGLSIFIMWMVGLFKISLKSVKIERKQYLPCLILLVGVIMPWMGIDLLFFDEFFLMMFYISLGFKWIQEQSVEVT